MKKTITGLLVVLACTGARAGGEVYLDGINYRIVQTGTERIRNAFRQYIDVPVYGAEVIERGNGRLYQGDLTVPDQITYDGADYPVTRLGARAFADCPKLRTVTLPDGITAVGDRAFMNDTSLTRVNVPEGVEYLPTGFFDGCTKLSDVTLPSTLVEIGEQVFENCSSLATLEMPAALSVLRPRAFEFATGLTYIDLPRGVRLIPDRAFHGCRALTNVTLRGDVLSIGEEAFSDCVNLQAAPLPASVTDIGMWAFASCTSLARAELPPGLTYLAQFAFYGCQGLTSVNLGKIRGIGRGCFQNCSQLRTIEGKMDYDSVYYLGPHPWPWEAGFNANKGLEAGDAPEPGYVATDAFRGCTALETVTLPADIESVGAHAFADCPNLKSLTLAGPLNTVNANAFEGSDNLTQVTLLSSVADAESLAQRLDDLALLLPDNASITPMLAGTNPQTLLQASNDDNASNGNGDASNGSGGDVSKAADGHAALKPATTTGSDAADSDNRRYDLTGRQLNDNATGLFIQGRKLRRVK